MEQHTLSRRDWLKLGAASVVGFSSSGWLEALAENNANNKDQKRACILLWMNGGPSHMDTFDLKPGHENGGPIKEIKTATPGLRISEHLPKLAKWSEEMAIIRSMTTKEADHGRGTYLMHIGRAPGGPIQYPSVGSFLAKELEDPDAALPSFVSIAPYRFFNPAAFASGFLGPRYAPLNVGENAVNFVPQPNQQVNYDQYLKVEDLALPGDVGKKRSDARVKLLDEMEEEFLKGRYSEVTQSHRTAYHRAVKLMRSEAAKAFDLSGEPKKLRDEYGQSLFGQSCLLARRLVERGVPFIEVSLSRVPGVQGLGWDTHQNNFDNVQKLSAVLDPAWATLMSDLKDRGLLETTTIVWMGEFGRTPKINGNKGRDHWARSWSTVIAGGGVKGGQAIGKTSEDGTDIKERPVSVEDFLATVCKALGIDPMKQNPSNVGRPIRLVEPKAKPITEALA